ncbi:MAG: S1C family serine protease [Patescibacteria group bacterium]|nr:S1C family serine protease [Patescibacteria group bacterium]
MKNKKEKGQHKLKDFFLSHTTTKIEQPIKVRWGWLVLLAIILGLAGGFVGTFVFLSSKNITIPLLGEYDIEEHLPKREITIQTHEKVTVTEDIRIQDLADRLIKQQVEIYLEKASSQNLLDNFYLPIESLGRAFILSSDGWLVSHKNIFPKLEKQYNLENLDLVAVTTEKYIYHVNKILIDPLTEIVFMKIQAENLPVTMLINGEDLNPGEAILSFSQQGFLETGRLQQLNYQELKETESLVKNLKDFSEYLLVGDKFNQEFVGSAIFNLDSKILGIIDQAGRAVPVSYLKNILGQVLESGQNLDSGDELIRPWIAIDYLEFSQLAGLQNTDYVEYRDGVLIYGDPDKTTLAYTLGLRNKDIILKINNDTINNEHTFLKLINEYNSNSEVELTVVNQEQERKVKIKLGAVE